MAVNLKTLGALGGDTETGFLGLVPCFQAQTCMIATGKPSNPDIPDTVTLKALDDSFTITNPHFCSAHNRSLPSLESSVVEKEFFGTEYEKIQIPPGPDTELYMLYTRCFVLHRQAPLTIARPDFISHFLAHGLDVPYVTHFPVPPTTACPAGTASIYLLFKNLAHKMQLAGLDDEIIRSLVPVSRKRSSEP